MTVTNGIGTGLYTLSEASRLTKVDAHTLRRWLDGYEYHYKGRTHRSGPRWSKQEGTGSSLGFLDLIEALVMGNFRARGVRWSTLHMTSEAAQKRFGVRHPFATLRFATDGREVFLEMASEAGDETLEEVAHSQAVFRPIIKPLLLDMDYKKDMAHRWWPLGKRHEVVLDPARSFGRPIVDSAAIPTAVLARAVKAEGSADRVAQWYDVSVKAVNYAVAFEQELRAA